MFRGADMLVMHGELQDAPRAGMNHQNQDPWFTVPSRMSKRGLGRDSMAAQII